MQATSLPGFGCGDFQLKAQNGGLICGRSMEFPILQQADVVTFNRGEKFESTAPDGTKGLEWTSKYGFTGINAFHINAPDEALNEAGLSFGVLTLEETEYQTVSDDQKGQALALLDVGNWILGNFATVAEVKEAIKNVRIWGEAVKPLNRVLGLHIALHDAEGNNGVIELIKGEVNFYDNPNGVLTNDPQLPWHLEGLKEYSHLTPESIVSPFSGDGMKGFPGEYSSISRFVRLTFFSRFAKPENEEKAIDSATHILNAMDLPDGVNIAKVGNETLCETTLWSSIKDLKNRIFYFRSHKDMTLNSIDLKKLPMEPGTIHPRVPVQAKKPTINDITNQLFQARVITNQPVLQPQACSWSLWNILPSLSFRTAQVKPVENVESVKGSKTETTPEREGSEMVIATSEKVVELIVNTEIIKTEETTKIEDSTNTEDSALTEVVTKIEIGTIADEQDQLPEEEQKVVGS